MEQDRKPRNKPTHLCQLIFNKGGNIQWEKDNLFNKWCWESWTVRCKSVKWEHILTPYMKINSKCLKGLNIRHSTIKLLEENIGKTFSGINCTNVFLGHSPKAIEIKPKTNRIIKLTSFCITKETIKWKCNLWNGRRNTQMMQPTRAQFPKYINSSYNSTTTTKQSNWKMGRSK